MQTDWPAEQSKWAALFAGWLYHLRLLSLSAYCLIAFVVVERRVATIIKLWP